MKIRFNWAARVAQHQSTLLNRMTLGSIAKVGVSAFVLAGGLYIGLSTAHAQTPLAVSSKALPTVAHTPKVSLQTGVAKRPATIVYYSGPTTIYNRVDPNATLNLEARPSTNQPVVAKATATPAAK